jgi:hypothetical protein
MRPILGSVTVVLALLAVPLAADAQSAVEKP